MIWIQKDALCCVFGISGKKQITSVLDNVTQMYGSIEGLVGQKALPTIEALSLEAVAEEDKE